MASFRGTLYSRVLSMDTGINVITPRYKGESSSDVKRTAYLLHGLSDNADAWVDNANLRELSTEYNMTFIIPEVQRSFYIDMAFGLDYFKYVSEELPVLSRDIFNIASEPKNTYAYGLSMGGYGALKLGMLYPKRFAGVGAFSPVSGIASAMKMEGLDISLKEKQSVFGLELEKIKENELSEIAKSFAGSEIKPDIYISCGKHDFLYQINKAFTERLNSLGIAHVFEDGDGTHCWEYWRKSLERALSIQIKGE